MGWIEDYKVHALSRSPMTPRKFHEHTALYTLSSVIGRSIYMEFGPGPVYACLWCLLVGASTLSKKTTGAFGLSRKMLTDVVPNLRGADTSSPEGLLKNCEELGSGKTYCQMWVMLDEFTRLLDQLNKDYMAATEEAMIVLKDGWPQKRRLSKCVVDVPATYMTFLSVSIGDSLSESLTKKNYIKGFAPRFLICIGDQNRYEKRPLVNAQMKAEYQRLADMLKKLVADYAGKTTEFRWSAEAQKFWDAWCVKMWRNSRKEDVAVQAIYGRLEDILLAVAMLKALSDNMTDGAATFFLGNEYEMDAKHFHTVSKMVELYLRDALRLYGQAGGDREVEMTYRVIARKGKCSRSDIINATHIRSPRPLDDVLRTLLDSNRIKKTSEKRAKGPAAEVYEVK
jgi:hypothetical protein